MYVHHGAPGADPGLSVGMIGAVYGSRGAIRIRVLERGSLYDLERFDGAEFRVIGSFSTRERALARMRVLARAGYSA